MTQKRTTPLTADVPEHDLESSVAPVVAHELSARERSERDARFRDGVRTLRVGGAAVRLDERILLVLAGIVAPLGLVVILLGYLGVSQTPFVFEQNSYLISGGIFGLALVFLGAFFYFAHWMTTLVKEHRVQSVAMLEAIQRLQDEVASLSTHGGGGAAPLRSLGNGHDGVPAAVLVATPRGTMAHVPTCPVVAGKTDLRRVEATDGLTPCKLCEPF
jgi:hypothetical protein